jgi:hypothetical protein
VKGRRLTSALEIALEAGEQALVLLLVCNGYDPNLEQASPGISRLGPGAGISSICFSSGARIHGEASIRIGPSTGPQLRNAPRRSVQHRGAREAVSL